MEVGSEGGSAVLELDSEDEGLVAGDALVALKGARSHKPSGKVRLTHGDSLGTGPWVAS